MTDYNPPTLDLKKIKDVLPYGNYHNWLIWKLRGLLTGESVRLPIFSAIRIVRYKDGFALQKADKFYGFATLESVMDFMQHDTYRPNYSMERLATIAKVNALFEKRPSIMAIAKETNLSWQLVNRYINVGKAVSVNAVDMAVSGI